MENDIGIVVASIPRSCLSDVHMRSMSQYNSRKGASKGAPCNVSEGDLSRSFVVTLGQWGWWPYPYLAMACHAPARFTTRTNQKPIGVPWCLSPLKLSPKPLSASRGVITVVVSQITAFSLAGHWTHGLAPVLTVLFIYGYWRIHLSWHRPHNESRCWGKRQRPF